MKIVSCFLLLALSCALAFAGDLSGKYSFSIKAVGVETQQGFLILRERGPKLSGSIALALDAHPKPIKNVQRQGNLLNFVASDNRGQPVSFRLKLDMAGFRGEANWEGRSFEIVETYPDGYHIGPGFARPKLTYRVEPEYTEEARQANRKGTVKLYTQINREGRTTNTRVLHSLGFGLDESAIAAVAKWKYVPAMRDGNPVIIEATIELDFHP